MKKIIIAVHGLGNKPPLDVLQEGWLKAIHEGLERFGRPRSPVPFEMVYWADISYPKPLDPEEKDPESPLFLKAPYRPSTSKPAPKPRRTYLALLRFMEKNLDRLFLRKNLKETFPAASAKMMERYFSDLDTYYTDECRSMENEDCSAKGAIQERLRQMLEKYAEYEILLLTHSMGSIIAFDVLSDPSNQVEINTFVTIGSPLGLPPIVARNFENQRTWVPALKRPKVPNCIWPHWYNLSDQRDHVALDQTLRDDYAPNARGARALDLRVINDYQIGDDTNPHKSYGYLRATETADIIDTFLSDQFDGRLRRTCRLITSNLLAAPHRLREKVS
ncbi:hypothetical protein P4B35_04625 [Pontiellaceae bacterium B12227]|nr:hypothetical protein [Pontiellaceae bacterium B12227]